MKWYQAEGVRLIVGGVDMTDALWPPDYNGERSVSVKKRTPSKHFEANGHAPCTGESCPFCKLTKPTLATPIKLQPIDPNDLRKGYRS